MARPLEQFDVGIMETKRSVDVPNFSKFLDFKLNEKFLITDFIIRDGNKRKNKDDVFERLHKIEEPILNCFISLKQIKGDKCISVSCSTNSELSELDFMHSYHLACTLSLESIDGLKFPQSFVVDGTAKSEEFEVFEISWKKLMDDSIELLPKDTLSLLFEICIDYCTRHVAYKRPMRIRTWAFKKGYLKHSSTDGTKLNLNSAIYLSLCRESDCFQGLQSCGLSEEKEGWMKLPSEEEVDRFAAMLYFIEYGTLHFVSSEEKNTVLSDPLLKRLLRLYKTADKYGVLNLLSFCRDFLMQYTLSKKSAAKVHLFAVACNDKKLQSYCNVINSRYSHPLSNSQEAVKKLKRKYTKRNGGMKKSLPRKKKKTLTFRRRHQYEYAFYN